MEFWINNITNKIVKINDLGLKLLPFQNINLLAIKKPKYTLEQIENSVYRGSLKDKKELIKISFKSPKISKPVNLLVSNKPFPRPLPSTIQITETQFEELQDDQFISPNLQNLIFDKSE